MVVTGHFDAAMIIRAITLSVRQLADRQTLWLLVKTVAITVAVFVISGIGLWVVLDRYVLPQWAGTAHSGWAAAAALAMLVLLGWFLFRGVAMAVMGIFADDIVASVEQDHYPAAARGATPVGFRRGLDMGLRSGARAIAWNMAAAPVYILLLFTAIGTPVLMVIINGLLLGRDLEAMVSARHPDGPAAPLSQRDRHILGFATAALFVIPVVNLLAPVFGAAMAVHLVHGKTEPR